MPRNIEPYIPNKEPVLTYGYEAKIPYNQTTKSDLFFQPTIASNKIESKMMPETWELTLERCIKSIVSIKYCRARGLDTEIPGAFSATGFVVDKERGILLSNRHVVSVSPITAHAVLCNYEEIELTPIYRDPVHDFGFFKYDPTQVRFLDIPNIELYPQGAKVGQDIRVVGNDAGEKLSILSGTLARIDRETPRYGIGEYNDFNTFYYQAASSTSSGSSGSPVLDLKGRAIALNAGGACSSSSSYYLPLDRVKRALQLIQQNQPIPRGTLQTTFEYLSYDALSQLGLGKQLERGLRSTQNNGEGLLVVKNILPDGPAYGLLEPGDILLSCNGQLLKGLFTDLEEHLDNAIEKNQSVRFVVSRGKEIKEFELNVQDLHEITPHRYLEFGGAILNDLSYQTARSYGLSLKDCGIFVGAAGYILGTAHAVRKSVIVAFNNKPIRNLDDFIKVVSEIEQGARVPVKYYSLSRPLKTKVMIAHVDWRWHLFRLAVRNDITGIWEYQLLQNRLNEIPMIKPNISALETIKEQDDPIKALEHSMVAVDCYSPYAIDGQRLSHSYGTGVVVSLEPPIIICDRDTIPVGICVMTATFENAVTTTAELLFLHPMYNYAILRFDVAPLVRANIKVYAAPLSGEKFELDESVNYVGLAGNDAISVKKATISTLAPVHTKEISHPRWRAMNVEAYKVCEGTLASQGGVLADNEGKVRAFWMSFSIENERKEQSSVMGGLPCQFVIDILNSIISEKKAVLRALDVEFWQLQLANARILGLSDDWIAKLKSKSTEKQIGAVYILGITDLSSPSGQLIKPGDIVLQINGKLPTRIADIDQYVNEKEILDMTVVRNGKEVELKVPITEYNGQETVEIIGWQGMIIQKAFAAAKEQSQKSLPEGVYVSFCYFGSPAQSTVFPNIWITEIDGVPVKSLEGFMKLVSKDEEDIQTSKPSENRTGDIQSLLTELNIEQLNEDSKESSTHVRIKYVGMDGVSHICTLRLDRHYWPTWHIKKDPSIPTGWSLNFL